MDGNNPEARDDERCSGKNKKLRLSGCSMSLELL